MKLKVLLILAYKSLWSHRLRAILTMSGVAIGVASIIFLVSLGYGLEQLVTDQVANFNAFSVIDVTTSNPKTIKIDQPAIEKISKNNNVAQVGPVANLAGRIKKKEADSAAETVVIAGENNYWEMADIKVDKGTMPTNKDEVVINKSVITLIGEDPENIIGKQIVLDMLISPELQKNTDSPLKTVKDVQLKVVGIMNEEISPIVYIKTDLLSINEADKYSALKVRVNAKEKDKIAETRAFLENMGYKTDYVGDTVSEINQVFSLFRVILAAFGMVALIVASLGTFNTLTISLLERIREVGLMKALGMRNRDIYKLFLTESLIIGLVGGIFGLLLGLGLGQALNLLLKILAMRSHVEIIQLFVTPWLFALAVASFSIIVGFLTGWYPSKRAVKIDPLDALRYE